MNPCVIDSPDALTVRTIDPFQDVLATALADEAEVTLELSALAEIDLSFLQLVEAARTEAARQGSTLRLSRPAGGIVADLLDRAGFLAAPSAADIDFWFHGTMPQ